MSFIFDAELMKERLEKYIPDGETLTAGIHCITKELHIYNYYLNAIVADNMLVGAADTEERVLRVKKSKYSTEDIYIGITQNYFVFDTCTECKFLYEFDYLKNNVQADVDKIDNTLPLKNIGHCFRLDDIVKCELKKGMFGSIKCMVEFNNGSTFNMLLPKLAGLGKGMPNHARFKDEIISRLTK